MKKILFVVFLLLSAIVPLSSANAAGSDFMGCPDTWNLASTDVQGFQVETQKMITQLGPSVAVTEVSRELQDKGEWFTFFSEKVRNPSEGQLFAFMSYNFPSRITYKIEVKNCTTSKVHTLTNSFPAGYFQTSYEKLNDDYAKLNPSDSRVLFQNFKQEEEWKSNFQASIKKMQTQISSGKSGGVFWYERNGKKRVISAYRFNNILGGIWNLSAIAVPDSLSCLALTNNLKTNNLKDIESPIGLWVPGGAKCNLQVLLIATFGDLKQPILVDSFSINSKPQVKYCQNQKNPAKISPADGKGKCPKGFKVVS